MTNLRGFDRALPHVLVHEGGKVDHPKDPGGRTGKPASRRTTKTLKGQSTRRMLLAALLISATPMLAICSSRTSISATGRVFCEAAQPITW